MFDCDRGRKPGQMSNDNSVLVGFHTQLRQYSTASLPITMFFSKKSAVAIIIALSPFIKAYKPVNVDSYFAITEIKGQKIAGECLAD